MRKHIIIGVHLSNRENKAVPVQQYLSEYGCNIKTRVGLHDADGDVCSNAGVILLEMVGDEKAAHDLAWKLGELEGVETKVMIFDHAGQ
jgi:hypothetical protein